jgi:hypothetical protein
MEKLGAMNDQPKGAPKVAWIHSTHTSMNISNTIALYTAVFEQPQNPGWVRFVDASAYDRVCAERDELLAKKIEELVCATEDVPPEYLHPGAGPVPSWRTMVRHLTKERDELRQALQALKERGNE